LERSYNEMVELKYVLEKDGNFFAEVSGIDTAVRVSPAVSVMTIRNTRLTSRPGCGGELWRQKDTRRRATDCGRRGRAELLVQRCQAWVSAIVRWSVATDTCHSSFLTGVVPRDKFSIFERVLFRATRGNLYMKYAEIEEPLKDNGQSVLKNVFIIFFQVRV
jgi:hypothetical protein